MGRGQLALEFACRKGHELRRREKTARQDGRGAFFILICP
jgi:hypothetical protein